MPRMWSKVRLVTTPNSSPDTIRLWLERSGPVVPLDIEIFLHVAVSSVKRSRSPTIHWSPPLGPVEWNNPFQNAIVHLPAPLPPALNHDGPGVITPPPHWIPSYVARSPSRTPSSSGSRTNSHWGHIAMYYLTEQMSRWQRFVFRFDKQFTSIGALKSIHGDAPLLEEFEVSCAEPLVYANDWPWMPSVTKASPDSLPRLRSVTLQYLPFRWSSPMLGPNLQSITLRSLPNFQTYIDRLLYVVASNPQLQELSLHLQNAQPAVLPLNPTTLPELRKLSIGGHFNIAALLESLTLPGLESLTLDVDPRESLEETITSLLARSNSPPLIHLSLSFNLQPLYYAGGGPVPWNFLSGLNHLRELQIGYLSFESILSALAVPDEDQNQWICPNLTHLALKNCHPHGDGIAKLVLMVDSRNPVNGSVNTHVAAWGGTPARLTCLEIYECTPLGDDILQWLRTRVEEVNFSEPEQQRSPRSPAYIYA